MVKIRNLTKIYKSKKSHDCVALDKVNITLPDTGMVFIIGKSGSGKSTLLNLIGGLDTITSGSIEIDGNELSKMNSKDFNNYRSSYLTFVFQDYRLFENLSVYQNVEVGLDVNNSVDKEVIKKSIERVGLQGYENRYPYELSGGQQQRVAIARALARNSKLILADEPTGNLDRNTSRQIMSILKEISKDKLIIIVSHNLMDADIYADRIIELQEGIIISDKEKRKHYVNSFKIENNKITLPHYYDLNKTQTEKMLSALKNNEINEVIQNDNGFSDYEHKQLDIKYTNFETKKCKNRSLLKLFKMFMKKRFHNKIIMVVFSVLLFTVLSVLQSFIMYEPKLTSVDKNQEIVVINKGDSIPFEDSLRTGGLYDITNDEYQKLCEISGTKVNKILNYTIAYTTYNTNVESKYTIQLYQYSKFYSKSTDGTLICDEDFLIKLLGCEKLEVLAGDLYDKPYGIIITDYFADSMIHYGKFSSYEDILGKYALNSYFNAAYINAIIKTDYKEKYGHLKDLYTDIENEEELYHLLTNNQEVLDYTNDLQLKYNISYTLNQNFEEDLIESELLETKATNRLTFESGEYFYKHKSAFSLVSASYYKRKYPGKYNLAEDEIILTPTIYNGIFGTMYTSDNYDLSLNNTITIRIHNNVNEKDTIVYEKEFKIIDLSSNAIVNEEVFKDIAKIQIINYGVYFEQNENTHSVITYANDHGCYIKTVDFESGLVINKMTSTFNTLFKIILGCIYVVFAVYIISYGINEVKHNKEEIGIYKALGGKFSNIYKVILFDVIITGLIISLLSIFFTPLILTIANNIVVTSFVNVLNLVAVNISIINIYPSMLALNYVLLNFLIILAALLPTFSLIRLKPIEIIKG